MSHTPVAIEITRACIQVARHVYGATERPVRLLTTVTQSVTLVDTQDFPLTATAAAAA